MTQMIFMGAKPSYFRADDGRIYDSCKVYLAATIAGEKATGYSGIELNYGLSADYDRIAATFKPMQPVTVDIEIQTTGKRITQVLKNMQPVSGKS